MIKSIVLTTGVFDVLHPGHIKLFEWIWEKMLTQNHLKDGWLTLVVGINGDRRANELKDRVIFTAEERAFVVQSCRYVNDVVIFEEDDPSALISMLKPVIFVKGGDYQNMSIPEMSLCEEIGVRFVVGPLVEKDGKKYSSSKIKGDIDSD